MKAKFNNGIIIDYPHSINSLEECRFFNWEYEDIYQFVVSNFLKLSCSNHIGLNELISSFDMHKDKKQVMSFAMDIDETIFYQNVRFFNPGVVPYSQDLFQLLD